MTDILSWTSDNLRRIGVDPQKLRPISLVKRMLPGAGTPLSKHPSQNIIKDAALASPAGGLRMPSWAKERAGVDSDWDNPVPFLKNMAHATAGSLADQARAATYSPWWGTPVPESWPSQSRDLAQLGRQTLEDPKGVAKQFGGGPGGLYNVGSTLYGGRGLPASAAKLARASVNKVKNLPAQLTGHDLQYPHMPRIQLDAKTRQRYATDPDYDYFIHGTSPAVLPNIQKAGQHYSAGKWFGTSLAAEFDKPHGNWSHMVEGGPKWKHDSLGGREAPGPQAGTILRAPKTKIKSAAAAEIAQAGQLRNPANPMNIPYNNMVGYLHKNPGDVPGMRKPPFAQKPHAPWDTAALPPKMTKPREIIPFTSKQRKQQLAHEAKVRELGRYYDQDLLTPPPEMEGLFGNMK